MKLCVASLRSSVLLTVILSLISAGNLLAQSTNRQIGTQLEVTADPLVPRPAQQPCVVPLFANYTFAFFSDSTQTFNFTPPGNCAGPWKKIVFEADFSENGGAQFDRTASIYLANANIYFGTTPEPLAVDTNTWHVERDITDYSALLAIPEAGTIVLANCTTDCPPPFNTLNGVFTVNADLEFYPADGAVSNEHPADQVLPLEQVNSDGSIGLPATLSTPTDLLSTTFTLPTNIERAYLDVVSQSQSTDEQWYACFPNDQSAINDLFGCGNTDFRETEITIDGQPAGIAPVSPWVYTGFLPDIWQPTPGVQTLQFIPYRVNLTPFAGMLDDGQPHTVALSIFNNGGFFSETANLLLFLDSGSTQVTGSVTSNTLTAPNPVITENLQGTDTVTGTINVASNRSHTITGFVNTSHGKVTTSIAQTQNFSGTQTIDFDTVNFTVLNQNADVKTSVASATTVTGNAGTRSTRDLFSFPISVDVVFPVNTALFGLTVDTTQKYSTQSVVTENGTVTQSVSVTDFGRANDLTPSLSSQQYTYTDSKGPSYNCHITSPDATLATVSAGCNSKQQ